MLELILFMKALSLKGLTYGFSIGCIGAVLSMFRIFAEVMTTGYVFLPF